jgi:transposase
MDSAQRFVALDVHKQYVMVAAIDATHKVVLSPRKISMEQFEHWAQAQLLRTDALVLEATTNAWTLYDLLAPLVAEAESSASLSGQTDCVTHGSRRTHATPSCLSRLLLAGLIPEVSRATQRSP